VATVTPALRAFALTLALLTLGWPQPGWTAARLTAGSNGSPAVEAAAAAGTATPTGVASPAGAAAADTEVVSRISTRDKVAALTFDAGSDAGHTQEILDILDRDGIKATFFLTGAWLDQNPDLAKAIVARGHAIGNHTETHPHLCDLTDEQVLAELTRTDEKAREVCGRSTQPLFRPPFGEYDSRVLRVAAEAGYSRVILWTIDSLDWKMIPAEELVHRVVDNIKPGAIVLMHVGSQTNEPQALPEIINQLKDQGYRFATLPELLADGGPSPPSEGTTVYTVKPGDTLSSIARTFGVSVKDLVTANGLTDADSIEAGATLVIPGGGSSPGGEKGGPADNKSGDQGGYGSDNSSSGRRPGLWARLWAGLTRFWEWLTGLASRVLSSV